MALKDLAGWTEEKGVPSAACGTACGAQDTPEETAGTACGTACGAQDAPEEAAGTGCGTGER